MSICPEAETLTCSPQAAETIPGLTSPSVPPGTARRRAVRGARRRDPVDRLYRRRGPAL